MDKSQVARFYGQWCKIKIIISSSSNLYFKHIS